MAARWRKGDLDQLHEWSLGGRRFGTVVTWFLVGGDLYTAYTFIAVPALAFGAGAVAFFAVPYTIVLYPIFFLVFPRIWQVCHKHNYITAADFVRGRFGSRWLALAVAVTGIIATMPYIALQLVGLQVVIGGLGLSGSGWASYLPLIIAFAHSGGLHAHQRAAGTGLDRHRQGHAHLHHDLRGHHRGSDASSAASARSSPRVPSRELTARAAACSQHRQLQRLCDAGVGIGAGAIPLSALDHRHPEQQQRAGSASQRRAAAELFIDARAAGADGVLCDRRRCCAVRPEFAEGFRQFHDSFAVPALFLQEFPAWFVGLAFAAVGIGALVPAAIMSIAAASLYTRNIHREFLHRTIDRPAGSAHRQVGLARGHVRRTAVHPVPAHPLRHLLQLLGGIWIIQTLPAVMLGAYTRWFNEHALLLGWAVGMVAGNGDGGGRPSDPHLRTSARRL